MPDTKEVNYAAVGAMDYKMCPRCKGSFAYVVPSTLELLLLLANVRSRWSKNNKVCGKCKGTGMVCSPVVNPPPSKANPT